jgi:hypothetical protein
MLKSPLALDDTIFDIILAEILFSRGPLGPRLLKMFGIQKVLPEIEAPFERGRRRSERP